MSVCLVPAQPRDFTPPPPRPPRPRGRPSLYFTPAKDALIRERYAWYRDRHLLRDLAELLQVALWRLYDRARRLGLTRKRREW